MKAVKSPAFLKASQTSWTYSIHTTGSLYVKATPDSLCLLAMATASAGESSGSRTVSVRGLAWEICQF